MPPVNDRVSYVIVIFPGHLLYPLPRLHIMYFEHISREMIDSVLLVILHCTIFMVYFLLVLRFYSPVNPMGIVERGQFT